MEDVLFNSIIMIKSLILNPLFQADDVNNDYDYLKKILDDNYFSVIEIWDTSDIRIINLIRKHSNDYEFDISLSPLMVKLGYDITSNDRTKRYVAAQYILKRMRLFSSFGINHISISSPKVVETCYNRKEKIKEFQNSLIEICNIANEYGVKVSLEPFDVYVDKKRLLGTTNEICLFFQDIVHELDNITLTWDLGHFCLEKSDYKSSLNILMPYIGRIHLSNYSLNTSKWYYGDKHTPFCNYGDINILDLVNVISNIEHYNEISIAFEVASNIMTPQCNSTMKTYNYIKKLYAIVDYFKKG